MRSPWTCLVAAVCAGVALTPPPARAADAPKIPDTPVGRQFAGWLAAFNTGDRETLRAFNVDHFAAPTLGQLKRDDRTDIYWRVAGHSGGLDVAQVRTPQENKLVAVARMKKTGDWARVELTVEERKPHGIVRIDFGPSSGPTPDVPAGRLTPEQIAQALGEQLDRLVRADEFAGTVLVMKDGKPVFARAAGSANKERMVPNRLDTKFSLASMGKMFTAVAVAQLAEHGKLTYDDPVGKHLPDYPNKDVARKVTIHQLLAHTSGVGDFFNDKWKARRTELRSVKDYLDLFADQPPAFEPGSKWQYSNGGYVILGAIVEKVTGRDYYEHVSEHVFRPAGMTRTGFFTPDESADDMATGYTHIGPDDKPVPGPWRGNAGHRPGRGNPAGGAWSTAEDLTRFADALRSGKLIKPESLEWLTKGHAEAGPDQKYGYGFMVHSVGGQRAFGQFGGFPGVSTALEVYPDLGYSVVILSNYDAGAPRLLMPVREWVTQR